MNRFIQRHADKVFGVLSGFDRLVLRGSLRTLSRADGMLKMLSVVGILLKDFGKFAESASKRLVSASEAVAKELGRPVRYLESSSNRKEDVARQIAAEDLVKEGLICVLKAVEPCQSFEIHRNREKKLLELVSRRRKCSFLYHYIQDPVLGFMSARVQTWFPFQIQVCINGREWLAQQLRAESIHFRKLDNCFSWVEDFQRAQELLDEQLTLSWPDTLDTTATFINPALREILGGWQEEYYWTVHQSEMATDLAFADPRELATLYPRLIRFGIANFDSPDVLRFLGRRPNADGSIPARFSQELRSDLGFRVEGMRLKHCLGQNSIKVYDKQGSILRVETTINDPSIFKAFRAVQGAEDRTKQWLPLRKNVADTYRRAEVSLAANLRYLDRLAAVEDDTPLAEAVASVCMPTQLDGRRVRALCPFSPKDAALLAAVARGEFAIQGFRNRDIRALLFPGTPHDKKETRRQSAAISRLLRILRAHRLITKVKGTHQYRVTQSGTCIITALLAARSASTKKLTDLAA